MKISRELKTGIAVILIIALSIWGFNFLKDRKLYDKTRDFYVEYANVQGLIQSSPVTINGLIVGKVSKISFHPAKEGVLIATINLTNDIKFSKNSIAQIYSPDFISGKSLKINIEYDDSELAVSGDTLKGEIDSGILGMINEQIGPLQAKVESFIVNTDTVMTNLNSVLDVENQKNLKTSLHNLSLTLDKFNNVAKNADNILENNNIKIDSILSNANVAMQNFSQLSDSLEKANLGETIVKLQKTLEGFNKILDSIDNGQGTIGKLLKDDKLYDNLEKASKELEELLKEVKMNPNRFVHLSVFGKKAKPYQEETNDE
ncbi:MAG: MCE family protein [Flavobacteriaceae bacterium]|nr:MCE family protein [Flavobacteriaceae bacterium]